MYVMSNFINKKVISIYEAQLIGRVINACVDKKLKRIYSLIISADDGVFNIPMTKLTIQGDALVIKNKSSIKDSDNKLLVKLPLGVSAYTSGGDEVGIVKDITFDENFYINEVIINDKNYKRESIASVSSNLVIIKDEAFEGLQAPRKRKSTATKIKKSTAEKKTTTTPIIEEEILNPPLVEDDAIVNEEVVEEIPSTLKPKTPARIISDYSFLLDRVVKNNIYTMKGDLLIEEGSIIDAEIVEKAKDNGKLVELTVGSRKED